MRGGRNSIYGAQHQAAAPCGRSIYFENGSQKQAPSNHLLGWILPDEQEKGFLGSRGTLRAAIDQTAKCSMSVARMPTKRGGQEGLDGSGVRAL